MILTPAPALQLHRLRLRNTALNRHELNLQHLQYSTGDVRDRILETGDGRQETGEGRQEMGDWETGRQ